MVGHMNIEEQADVDFARRRAFLRRIGGRPSNGSYRDRLLCFEDTRGRLGALGGVCRGLRGVRPTDVIGKRFGYRESEGLLDDSTAISIRAALHREGGAP